MEKKLKLKQLLEDRLIADLNLIDHESLNHTLVGYSQKYNRQVFVKVFAQLRKLQTEKAVNQQLNSRVLEWFRLEGADLFALVMTDLAPVALTGQITPQVAHTMGERLADFHRQVKPFPGIVSSAALFVKAQGDIANLKDQDVRDKFEELFDAFSKLEAPIAADIQSNSRYVLHGDVGVRNYQYVAGSLVLIDFERARLGVNYLDFVKLFYQDFELDKELIEAFLDGYSSSGLQVEVHEEAQAFLIFMTAIGIMKYTDQIDDPKFKAVGLRMLAAPTCLLTQKGLLNQQRRSKRAVDTAILNSIIKVD
ncbi:phosphotransferase [Lactobacillus xylocopicola]|uniref:Aminoglycoside phosphotransferase domain-containing protein n=1 Tax=Lactobacillus xylocopicola TaxID=2976676 RepID=A0ABM8BI44_9LACO|nr:phosphotransferase [Lactobacillus xylocopicola]BDR60962.1 hypothetical protein KIM322_12230 [Lactobacillus xylocopicola]